MRFLMLILCLFTVTCFAKEAEFVIPKKQKDLGVGEIKFYDDKTVKILWIAKVGNEYFWKEVDSDKFYNSISEYMIMHPNFVGEPIKNIKEIKNAVILDSIPSLQTLVICACNGKSERVPVKMDGNSHFHETKN